MKVTIFTSIILFSLVLKASAEIISIQKVEGKDYYIALEKFNGIPELWVRENPNITSRNDRKLGAFSIKSVSKHDAMKCVCRGKTLYDNGTLILECASAVGSATCVVTECSSGFATSICVFAIQYGIDTGFIGCVLGL